MAVANFIEKGIRLKVACSRNNDVLANVEVVMVLSDLLAVDRVDYILDTSGRLTHEVVPEGSIVNSLAGNIVGVHRRGPLVDGWFDCFHLHCIVSGVQYDLGQKVDCLGQLGRVEGESKLSQFAANLNLQLATDTFDDLLDLVFGVFASAIAGGVSSEVGY